MIEDFVFDLLARSVEEGEKRGSEFIEARYDDLQISTIIYINEIINESSLTNRKGIGIVAYFKGTPGYSFTPELNWEGVKQATHRAVKLAKSTSELNTLKLDFEKNKEVKDIRISDIKKHPKNYEFQDKLDLLQRGVNTLKENVDASTTQALYGEFYGEKYFVNSDGSEIYWQPIVLDLRVGGIVVNNGQQAVAGDIASQSKGFELFEEKRNTPESLGENAGKWTKEQIDAVPAPTGKTTTLVSSRLGGIVVHESFGHLSEADLIVTGMSPISDRLGEQLGSEHVTLIDEGISPYGGFYLPYDDQGIATSKTVILDKGVLKEYLHDRGTANKLNTEPSGNSRALNFMFNPICRMKNTYFEKGDLSQEEAFEIIKNGLYGVDFTGGQVSLDGNFVFNCFRGYLIENGEIGKPIRNTALSGNILELLKHVQGTTKDMEIHTSYFGGCGKGPQFPLPVGFGGSEVIMDQVLVGGAK